MGNKKNERRESRRKGESYCTKRGFTVEAAKLPSNVLGCKCQRQCQALSWSHRKQLCTLYRSLSSKAQKTYISNLLSIVPVTRRHSDEPNSSQRQVTTLYSLPDEENKLSDVCKSTFIDTLGVSRKVIDLLVKKKKLGITDPADQRGGRYNVKFTEEDRETVKNHIRSLPRDISHYGRKDLEREYLSCDLTFADMYRAFQEKYPESKVNLKYYKKIFKLDFPQLSFHQPRVDTCKTCDNLHCQISSAPDASAAASMRNTLALHHGKASRARAAMETDIMLTRVAHNDVTCISIDLQQVLPLPSLTHSDMFYLRQVSFYNLGIHSHPGNDATMCLWHEAQGGRGANEIASCIFTLLNTGKITLNKNLCVWSDNWAGKNKNKIVIFMYFFLIYFGVVQVIDHKFLISGHSFLECDRDFALIEKKRKKKTCVVPDDLREVIRAARSRPFQVEDMEIFYDFKDGADYFLNTKKVGLSTAVWIQIDEPGKVKIKRTFDATEFEVYSVWKRGKSITDLETYELRRLPSKPLSNEKKNDVKKMLDVIPPRHHQFYNELLN